jgi:hypothetical protein
MTCKKLWLKAETSKKRKMHPSTYHCRAKNHDNSDEENLFNTIVSLKVLTQETE